VLFLGFFFVVVFQGFQSLLFPFLGGGAPPPAPPAGAERGVVYRCSNFNLVVKQLAFSLRIPRGDHEEGRGKIPACFLIVCLPFQFVFPFQREGVEEEKEEKR